MKKGKKSEAQVAPASTDSSDSPSDSDILGEWDHWMDDFCD